MQKTYLTFLLCICLGYSSCSLNKKNTDVQHVASVVRLCNDSLLANDTVFLSQIAENVTYISLDMPNESEIFQLEYTDSIIYMNDMEGVYWFNHQGEKIGSIVSRCNSFALSNQRDSIYIYQPLEKRISCYNLQGECVWRSRLSYSGKEFGYYGHFFTQMDDALFIIATPNKGYTLDRLLFVDKQGQVKKRISNPEMFVAPKTNYAAYMNWQRSLTKNGQEIFYYPMYGDTVYRITNDMQLVPSIIDQKIKKVPMECRPEYTGKTWKEFEQDCLKHPMYATRIFNASRYAIIEYKLGSIGYRMPNYWVYDRIEKTWKRSFCDMEIDAFQENRWAHFGIYNDYDGGLAFAPDFISNDHLIMVNAGEVQGHKTIYAKRIYANDFMQWTYRSDVYKELVLKQKADSFWNNCDENKLVLTIVKTRGR